MIAAERQRLDKWLWFARVTKTRTQAQKLAESGRVRLNRNRMDSAHHPVRPGDVLTIAFDGRVRVLRIVAPGERRGSPADARLLYEDLSPRARAPAGTPETGTAGDEPAEPGAA